MQVAHQVSPLAPARLERAEAACDELVTPYVFTGYPNAVKLRPISDTHVAEFSHQGPRIFAGMICHGESY